MAVIIGILPIVPLSMSAGDLTTASAAEKTPTYTSETPPFDPNIHNSDITSSSTLTLETGDPVTAAYWVINTLLTFLGLAFVTLLVYGGTIWIIARGNAEEIEKAKKFIRNGVIGLIIVLASYSISAVVFDTISKSYAESAETTP